MRNVSALAATAAPIRSGTDDAVGTGRRVRAGSRVGAAAGGLVVEVVLGVGEVGVGLGVVVVGGRVGVVVGSGSVSVVVGSGSVSVVVGNGSVSVVVGN